MAAYIPVGLPVLKDAINSIRYSDFFSEFFLMSIATLGAFAIGEYPEGVAVMLFYSVGEVFQAMAVQRAKKNIKGLLDQRPDEITILENNIPRVIKAETAKVGHIIQLKPGEKLALDGELISESASFNTAALTGESKPDTKRKGEAVLAGMINLNSVSQVIVQKSIKTVSFQKFWNWYRMQPLKKHQLSFSSGNLQKCTRLSSLFWLLLFVYYLTFSLKTMNLKLGYTAP